MHHPLVLCCPYGKLLSNASSSCPLPSIWKFAGHFDYIFADDIDVLAPKNVNADMIAE